VTDRWHQRHAERGLRSEPADFVVAVSEWFHPGGRVLDVAGGTGRNAIWLARRGFAVTLIDFSPVAVALVAEGAAEAGLPLSATLWNVETDGLPIGPWDAIVIHHFLDRPSLDVALDRLRRGGVLAFCQPTLRNLERHEHPGERWLLAEGELEEWTGNRSDRLQVLTLEEEWFDNGRHEARLVARYRPRTQRSEV